ncbi:transcription initiation factor TFIID subunit 7, partial [Tanacetum coccineum]
MALGNQRSVDDVALEAMALENQISLDADLQPMALGNQTRLDVELCRYLISSILDNGRRGTFTIGDDQFPTSLFDLPCIVKSHKTYDDSVLIKTVDVGQGDLEVVEYRHGLTPPMRDARRRRFHREPDLNVRYLIILNLLLLKFNLDVTILTLMNGIEKGSSTSGSVYSRNQTQ